MVTLVIPVAHASKFHQASDDDMDVIEFEGDSKCFKSIHSIRTSSELLQVADCSVISGSITIDEFDSDFMDLGAISEIRGDLSVSNASSIERIQGSNLELVGGTFQFDTLTSLTSLSFPKLQAVETLRWHVLPILTSVNFKSGIKDIKSVVMSDTSLTGFGGFNFERLRNLNINNNRFLERIESSVAEITGELSISANAENLNVILPNLIRVKSLTVKDAEEVQLDSLQIVDKNADFIANEFDSLSLPKLKSTGHTLSIIDNFNLENLDFGSLTEVGGGLMVIDNANINKVDFFPKLKSVGGAVEMHGNIASTEFKEIKIVKGSAILKSKSNEIDCSEWMVEELAKAVRGGKIECSGGEGMRAVKHVDDGGKVTKEIKEPQNGGGKLNKNITSSGWIIKASAVSVLAGCLVAISWTQI